MPWKGYQTCCRMRALDAAARVCADCGQLLLRCRSFPECRALVAPLEACPVHVAPRLSLQRDAVLTATCGDRVALPLLLANAAVGALRLRQVYRCPPGGAFEAIAPLWETLPAGAEKALTIDSGALEAGGTARVGLVLAFAVDLGGIEEDYAFAAEILLQVRRSETQQVIQNIHVEGGSFAAGAAAVVQTGPSLHEAFRAPAAAPGSGGPLPLERAEAFELRAGLRGYRETGWRVGRGVELECRGFPDGDAPDVDRPFAHGVCFTIGRNGCTAHADNPVPNDLSLRVHRPGGGGLDQHRTGSISGRHLQLFLQHDRLVVRALGRNGTRVNDAELPIGATAVLQSGDRIGVLEPGAGGPELTVSMTARDAVVERVVLTRER